MTKVWFRLIQKELKTIEDVPSKLKAEVQALLEQEG